MARNVAVQEIVDEVQILCQDPLHALASEASYLRRVNRAHAQSVQDEFIFRRKKFFEDRRNNLHNGESAADMIGIAIACHAENRLTQFIGRGF